MAMFEQGKIDPLIGAEFALSDYAAALNCLAERKAVSKSSSTCKKSNYAIDLES